MARLPERGKTPLEDGRHLPSEDGRPGVRAREGPQSVCSHLGFGLLRLAAHGGARDLLEQILLRRCLICPITDRSDAMASLSTLVVLAEPQLMAIPGGKGLLK